MSGPTPQAAPTSAPANDEKKACSLSLLGYCLWETKAKPKEPYSQTPEPNAQQRSQERLDDISKNKQVWRRALEGLMDLSSQGKKKGEEK